MFFHFRTDSSHSYSSCTTMESNGASSHKGYYDNPVGSATSEQTTDSHSGSTKTT